MKLGVGFRSRPSGQPLTEEASALLLLVGSAPRGASFSVSQAHGIVAFDFFTVEAVRLCTMYVLFGIGLGSRRLHVLGIRP